jgi:hypothetical protein
VTDQRVDLDQTDVLFQKQVVKAIHDLGELAYLLRIESHAKAQLTGLVGHETGGRIDSRGYDLLRRFGSNLLDVDATGGRTHEDHRLVRTVDQRTEVKLLLDVGSFCDQHGIDRQCPATGLVGLDGHAQHALGFGPHVVQAGHQLHAACLAAATGMDLGLDHPLTTTELLGSGHGFVAIGGHVTARHGNPVLLEQLLGLILMKVHA